MILFYDNNISFCTKIVFVLPYQRIWKLQLLHPHLVSSHNSQDNQHQRNQYFLHLYFRAEVHVSVTLIFFERQIILNGDQ